MKKLLLATAVAALSVTAQAAPTVYGKVFATLDYDSESKKVELNDQGSRIGFKDDTGIALNADNSLTYGLEYQLTIDSLSSDNFKSRNTFIGLKNKNFGEFKVGRLAAIDSNITSDFVDVTATYKLGPTFNGKRSNDAIVYSSNKYHNGAAQFHGMVVLDDNATDGLGRDAFGIAGSYTDPAGKYYAGASFIKHKQAQFARVNGHYAINNNFTVGALYQNGKTGATGTATESTIVVSGTYDLPNNPWTAYGQLSLVDNAKYVKGTDTKTLSGGGKYDFGNKKTTGHLYAQLGDDDVYGVGAGIEHKF